MVHMICSEDACAYGIHPFFIIAVTSSCSPWRRTGSRVILRLSESLRRATSSAMRTLCISFRGA